MIGWRKENSNRQLQNLLVNEYKYNLHARAGHIWQLLGHLLGWGVVHHSVVIKINGKSCRKKDIKKEVKHKIFLFKLWNFHAHNSGILVDFEATSEPFCYKAELAEKAKSIFNVLNK